MLLARKVSFDLSGNIPKHWLNNEPVRTHFLNAFSIVLPEYERFFIIAVNRSRKLVCNPSLKDDVQGFCAQEGAHASEHRKYNQLLVRQGYSAIPRFESRLSRFFTFVLSKTSPEWLLAFTAAGEHVTAFMGEDFLRKPEVWSRNTSPDLDALWRWHAAEEIEHRAVCFDVFQEICGQRWRRCLALLMMSLTTLVTVSSLQFYLIGKDGLLAKPVIWKNYGQFMFGQDGFLKKLVKQYFRFFRRDFHPHS